ncbi:hypothetical protein FWK35_00002746 [Aphis craccivora]|uniref:Uncharacterized protein n=1 Tax=Aphis craccivora TaxID=307492 RepID=A0A6G0ZL05_APHCR|nr:hypothetical protein FWK35_00002746 [Aphis craccivora]
MYNQFDMRVLGSGTNSVPAVGESGVVPDDRQNHSERSDECIDFTMMCVFFFLFLCLSPRFGAVKVLRFKKVSPVSDRKVNLIDHTTSIVLSCSKINTFKYYN